MLLGRTEERARLGRLVREACDGRGGALAVVAPPGHGKSALLSEAASTAAPELTVLRATGVQAEGALPFAVLQQLLAPAGDAIDTLPDHLAAALAPAVGRAARHGPADPMLVALATLTLLTDAATRERPVLCVVDDVQWVDGESLRVLTFVGRRLVSDPVALLLASRPEGRPQLEQAGVEVLPLGDLEPADVEAVVRSRAPVPVDAAVARALATAASGSPLAAVEMVRALSADQLTGAEPLPSPLPVASGALQHYRAQVTALPEATRRILLLAALADPSTVDLVALAADDPRSPADALGPAERIGAVRVDADLIAFRHPLARAASVQSSTLSDRQAAHTALARAYERLGDTDRAAWHAGSATVTPDQAVADRLTRAAERAARTAGHRTAGRLLERAATLSVDPDARTDRLLRAAKAYWLAGDTTDSAAVLDRVRATGPATRAAVSGLRGQVEQRVGHPGRALALLESCADLTREIDGARAAAVYLAAAESGLRAADPAAVHRLAGKADDATRTRDRSGAPACVLRGLAAALAGDAAAAAPELERAGAALEREPEPLAQLLLAAALTLLGDAVPAAAQARAAERLVRDRGFVSLVPWVGEYTAAIALTRGRLGEASADAAEGLRLAEELAQPLSASVHRGHLAAVAAVRGEQETCREHAAAARSWAVAHGCWLTAASASWSLALLDCGLGRFEDAVARLSEAGDIGSAVRLVPWTAGPDLVEAAVRTGRRDVAARARDALSARLAAAPRPAPSARSAVLRVEGLLAAPDDAVDVLADALTALGPEGSLLERARLQLLRGEAMRRSRRRAGARDDLAAAADAFDALGARPWAERARTELRATGASLVRRSGSPVDLSVLTPQELQIARMVATGASNREIAATLFVSHRTVESHLYKVYPRLGVSSRTELTRLVLAADGG